MHSRFLVCSLVFVLAALGAAAPAAAQDDYRGSVFLGYSFLGNDDLAVNTSTLPWGWSGGGDIRINDWFSIAIDLGGNFKHGLRPCGNDRPLGDPECRILEGVETPSPTTEFQGLSFHRTEREWCSPVLQPTDDFPSNPGCEVSLNSQAIFGGPRVSFQVGDVRLYAHVLPGLSRSTRSIDFFTHTAMNFAIMPGGGVDFPVTDVLGVRFQGDYQRVFFPNPDDSNSSLVSRDNYNQFRFMTGVTVKVGRR